MELESDLKDLSIDNAASIVLFPYREVKDESWPTYINSDDKRVPIPKGWRYVGYRYPYPDVKRVHSVKELSSGLSMKGSGDEVNIRTGDPLKLAKHLSYNLIKGVVREDPSTGKKREQTLDNSLREWLCGELQKSSFLLSGAYQDYLREGEKEAEKEAQEDKVFTEPSEITG